MTTYSNLPTYDQKLTAGDNTSKVWYFFFKALHDGQPTGAEFAVTLTGSPFSFLAPSKGFVIVQGGTVTIIQFSRNGTTNYNVGITQGIVPVSANDRVLIYYTATPNFTFVPQ